MKRKLLTLSLALLMVTVIFAGCMGALEFDVNFISDGEIIHTISTTGDETIKMPENPVKEGYTFDGWYWDKDTWQRPFTASSLLNEPLNGDMSVYAKWTPKDLENESFEVSFNTMGGSDVNGQIVKYNGFVSEPAEPTKNGYIFAGWYKDADLQGKWDFLTDKVTGKTTIYAKWVSANDNEGAEIISADGFEMDGSTLKMTVPYEKENVAVSALIKVSPSATYMVSKDIEGNEAIPTGTVTLNEGKNVFYILVTSGSGSNKSQYTVEITREKAPPYVITLNTNGGEVEGENFVLVEVGNELTALPAPTKEGYRFDGWMLSNEIIALPYKPSEDIELTASWTRTVTVTLELNGGTVSGESVIIVGIDEAINTLPTPIKEGYRFDGWTLNGELLSLPYTPSESISVFALWTKQAKITLDPNGGELEEDTALVEIGQSVDALPTPIRQGYRFDGWALNGEIVAFPYSPNEDVTLSAVWTEVIAITLDSNGGTLENGQENIIYIEVNKAIGTLPTPQKYGYSFLGWFEDGNEKWEIETRTRAEYDMEAVALWSPLDFLVTVEFKVEEGQTLDYTETFIEVLVGDKICDAVSSLPTASRDGFKFKGWQDEAGNLVTITTRIEGELVLSPIWERIVYCLDGTENHVWNAWLETTEATCTEAGKMARMCGVCGHIEYKVTQKAYGHDFVVQKNDSFYTKTVCKNCETVKIIESENITFECFETPIIEGDCWGAGNGNNLIDGDFTNKNVAGKGTGSITVTLNAKEATYIDFFTVTGDGSASYTVTVTYADGTASTLGVGSFEADGATKAFTVKAEIIKVVIYMETPSKGEDYWQEVGAFVDKEVDGTHAFNETISIGDGGEVSLIRDCVFCDLIITQVLKNITYDNFHTPGVDGDYYYGSSGPISLIDGDFVSQSIAGKGTGTITVTLNAKNATYIDIFTVTGAGSAAYTVTVTYADGTARTLGMGTFGCTKAFRIEAEITKVIIYMEASSNGADLWKELGAFVIPKTVCEFHTFTELGFNHQGFALEMAPTCTEKGYIGKECIDCGVQVLEYLDETGHSWGTWGIEGDCQSGATKTRWCQNGNCYKSEEIIVEAGEHIEPEYQGAKAPTLEEEGTTGTLVCTSCGETIMEAKVISKLVNVASGSTVTTDSDFWCTSPSTCLNKIVDGDRETALASDPRCSTVNDTITFAQANEIKQVILVVNGMGVASDGQTVSEITTNDYTISFVLYDESGNAVYASEKIATLGLQELIVNIPEGISAKSIQITRFSKAYVTTNYLWEVEVISGGEIVE